MKSYSPHKRVISCGSKALSLLLSLGKVLAFVWLGTFTALAFPIDKTVHHFDIPEQDLIQSIHILSTEAQTLILFPYALVENRKGNAVTGHYTVLEALNKVLEKTGLMGLPSKTGALTISTRSGLGPYSIRGDESMHSKKKLLASLVSFFVGSAGVAPVLNAAEGDDAGGGFQIDEIVVTATKRDTSLQDTAMAISVLSAETIEQRGLVGMDDYLRGLPGVSMQDLGAGQGSVVIRGISGNPQQQSEFAGVYFGETSLTGFGTSSAVAFGAGNIDIKLVDIKQIEVLRGPQGTLYGSDAMAGVVRTMPFAPNLNEVEGKLATRFSQTGEEGGNNTMVQGVLSVPVIEDTLAVRGVVYQFDNSGYINNVVVSQPPSGFPTTVGVYGGVAEERDDVGGDEYTGFRLAALWQPVEELDITLTYLEQDIDQDGHPEVSLNLEGDYEQRQYDVGVGGSHYPLLENEVEITSLVVNYDLGWGKVTSASSWIDYTSRYEADFTHLATLFGLTDQPYGFHNGRVSDAFTEEVRLASNLDGPVQFVAGLYYSDKESDFDISQSWTGDIAQDPGVILQTNSGVESLEQKSVFGEVSYAITEQVTATLGARSYEYERDNDSVYKFTTVVTTPTVTNVVDRGQLYKANLSYTPNDDTLLYAQWSEGFHPGRGEADNPFCDAIGVPPAGALEPDTTSNTELGFKTTFADSRVSFNAALYRIDWENIPVLVNNGSNCFQEVNAAKARSEGIEIEIQAQLVESFRTDINLSYGESKLEGDSGIGNDGDDLPGSSDFNASVALQYDFSLFERNSFTRLDYTYISEYYSSVAGAASTVTPTPAGGFGQFNLNAGVEFDNIDVSVFVNNLTNDDGLTWVEVNGSSLLGDSNAYRIRPRTIGVNLSYQF